MNYNLTIWKNIGRLLSTALVYLMIFAIILTVYEGSIITPWYLSGIPVILICYLVIERYCYQPVVYILLHGIFFVLVWKMNFPSTCYQYLYLMLLTAENVHAVLVWKRNIEKPYEEAPWGLFLIVTLIYIITLAYKATTLSNLVFYCGTGLLVIHFFRLSLEGISNMLSQSQHATSVPTKRIILTNSVMTGFITMVFFLIIVFLHTFELDHLMYSVGEYLLKAFHSVVRFILYLIGILRALFSVESHVENTATKEELEENLGELLESIHEPSLLARIIDGFCTTAALLCLLYLLYRIVLYFVKLFSHRYAKDSDLIVSLHHTKEKVIAKKEKSTMLEKIKTLFRTDNAARVRRAYRFKIKSFTPEIYKRNDTPKDIAEKVLKTYNEDISQLTGVYEKARYSNEEITFEDVQKGGIL